MPQPNDFSNTVATIDGVNTASYRCLRGYRGLDNLWSVGEGTGNRKQINVKIDHNFSQKHLGDDPERPLFENPASETKDFRRRNQPKTGFPDRPLGNVNVSVERVVSDD